MLPVVIINVIKIGIKELVNATKLSIDSFTMLKTSVKLLIMIVTIKINST